MGFELSVREWLYKVWKLYIRNSQKKEGMLNLILFGPPGSGKGTQAAKLVDKYQLLHISTGDLFRYEMKNDTPLGMKAKEYMAKGELVPDEVTIGMLKNKVEANLDANGFIFDGFPRTMPQAKALEDYLGTKSLEVDALVALQVDDDEIVARILNRGKTSGRADDNDESIIRNRIEVYKQETSPIFDYFGEKQKSHAVEGLGTIDEIFDRLCVLIEEIHV